jgi:hypothetical protein
MVGAFDPTSDMRPAPDGRGRRACGPGRCDLCVHPRHHFRCRRPRLPADPHGARDACRAGSGDGGEERGRESCREAPAEQVKKGGEHAIGVGGGDDAESSPAPAVTRRAALLWPEPSSPGSRGAARVACGLSALAAASGRRDSCIVRAAGEGLVDATARDVSGPLAAEVDAAAIAGTPARRRADRPRPGRRLAVPRGRERPDWALEARQAGTLRPPSGLC